jgi:RNA polymerase-binding transcription factor DksA
MTPLERLGFALASVEDQLTTVPRPAYEPPHGDVADQRQAIEERRGSTTELARLQARRAAILAALQRIEEGIYGSCRACQQAIPPARLTAVPWAERCAPCQEAVEAGRPDIHPSPDAQSEWA